MRYKECSYVTEARINFIAGHSSLIILDAYNLLQILKEQPLKGNASHGNSHVILYSLQNVSHPAYKMMNMLFCSSDLLLVVSPPQSCTQRQKTACVSLQSPLLNPVLYTYYLLYLMTPRAIQLIIFVQQ